jgi:hypothetical protein
MKISKRDLVLVGISLLFIISMTFVSIKVIEKAECFENPCSQCMRLGYLCTNPYANFNQGQIEGLKEDLCYANKT